MKLSRFVATAAGVGLLRPAPGTWGSLAAIALGVFLHRLGHFPLLALATCAAVALGFWSVTREVEGKDDKDPSEIVIDEVAGQWIALLFPSAAFWIVGAESTTFPWPGYLTAFILFRIFDIWKPGIIGRADRRGDAAGVMLDDLWAGVFAGILTLVIAGIAHGVLLQ
ncbi:MAG: phosphatidylglycerophosphatase A [Paracoccaceae bacterium]